MTVRALFATLAMLLAVGCQPQGWESFSTRHASYRFAGGDVVSKEASYRFIRLSPSGESFELVFDGRISGQMDRRGYRRIFSLGDGPLAGVAYRRTPAGTVACHTGVAAIECGLALISGDDQWSLLFPASRKASVVEIAARARNYLAAHRTTYRSDTRTAVHYRCADNSWLLVREDETSARVDRPDIARTLDRRTASNGRSYAAQGFTLSLEGEQARWIAPHHQPLPCLSTHPTT